MKRYRILFQLNGIKKEIDVTAEGRIDARRLIETKYADSIIEVLRIGEEVKGFKPIIGRIMVSGSSTVGPSRKNGFAYTSRGANYLWDVFDASIKTAFGSLKDGERTFKDIVKDYKKVKLTDEEYQIIENLLDDDKYLYEVDSYTLTPNLLRRQRLQIELISKMNKYGFGVTDAISSCFMDGTGDKDRVGDKVYNSSLKEEIENAEITIINGISTNEESSIGSFRNALGIFGKQFDDKYNIIKQECNVVELLSTSGMCPSPKEEVISAWVKVIVKYLK